jgi:hypothetical protein
MDKYYVIYCNGKYAESGISINEYIDRDEVDAFLTKLLSTEQRVIRIIKGKLVEWEKYQIETKARII